MQNYKKKGVTGGLCLNFSVVNLLIIQSSAVSALGESCGIRKPLFLCTIYFIFARYSPSFIDQLNSFKIIILS